MTHFRPCIDLHNGRVKQIVGGSLSEDESQLRTNFESEQPSSYYAKLYQRDKLRGGHVIKLGGGNEEAALSALASYPGGLQIGGGITPENAPEWIAAAASHVIVTSALFDDQGQFLPHILSQLVEAVGAEKLVIDLSCRRTTTGWSVAMNRWQTITDMPISTKTLDMLANSCDEFLIHAADVEGKCQGIDRELVSMLGAWRGRPITYAGGINSIDDFELIDQLSGGTIDATVGSALDIFGGSQVNYSELVTRRS